jgi:hypothetical protein
VGTSSAFALGGSGGNQPSEGDDQIDCPSKLSTPRIHRSPHSDIAGGIGPTFH